MKDETVSEAEEISGVEDEAVATLIAVEEVDSVLDADHGHLHQRDIATTVTLEARSVAVTGTFRKVVEAAPVITGIGALGAARVLLLILHGPAREVPVRNGHAALLIMLPVLGIATVREVEREVRRETAPGNDLGLHTGTLLHAGGAGGGGARGLGPNRGHLLGPSPGLDPLTAAPRLQKDVGIHPLPQSHQETTHEVVGEGVPRA